MAQPEDGNAEAEFGLAVRRARNLLGWTQEQVRRRLLDSFGVNLSKTAMARLEQGGRPIRFNEVYALAQILDIDLSSYGRPKAPAVAPAETFHMDMDTARAYAVVLERRRAVETELAGLTAHLEWLQDSEKQAADRLVEVRETLTLMNSFVQGVRRGAATAELQPMIDYLLGEGYGDR